MQKYHNPWLPISALKTLAVACVVALLFLRSTAGSFWSAENRFFLHWQRADTLGILGAILVVGLAFCLAWRLLGQGGRFGRWLREALFIAIALQYARINVAESLDAVNRLTPWLIQTLRMAQGTAMLAFLFKRRSVVTGVRSACLIVSPILAIYAWTLVTARTYDQPQWNRKARLTLAAWSREKADTPATRHSLTEKVSGGASNSHYDAVPRDLASREREIGVERHAFPPQSQAPAAQGGRGPSQNQNRWGGAWHRRIVLIVFDEWSYTRTFDGARVRPEFPELARVADRGIVFTEAYAPGTTTLVSLPAMLSGQAGSSRIAADGTLWFKTDDVEHPFREMPTVFSDFQERGYRTAMIGNYLPYADLIGHDTDLCISFDLYRILGSAPPALATSMILENVRIRLGFIHPLIGAPFYWTKHRYFASMAETIHEKTLRLLRTPDPLFAMVHHSIPHMPFVFDRDGARNGLHRPATLDIDDYEGNLHYMDLLIGELYDVARAQSDGGPVLILTADHGFRADPMWVGLPSDEAERRQKHVPLIIAPPELAEGRVVETPFELTELREWLNTGGEHAIGLY